MKNVKLKSALLLIPSLVLLTAFVIIYATFNIVIHWYIESSTAEAIEEQFLYFDEFYENHFKDVDYNNEELEFIIPAYYIILDEKAQILYPEEPWFSDVEKERSIAMSNLFRRNPSMANEYSFTIDVAGNTYYVRPKTYLGEYQDYYIVKSFSRPAKTYTVLVFTNITPIQNFLNLLSRILVVLMLGSGLLSILAFFGMAKKMDTSFAKLKDYIIRVGRRESLPDLYDLPYEEFNDVAQTVQKMSAMIERAEESQKYFFQNASHELRTPLMSIQGYAEGIHTGVINEKKASDIIIKESEKMSSLVDEILFLSKMDTDDLQMQYEEINLKELLYDCSWRIKAAADKNNISISHHFDQNLSPIQGDEKLLERAFVNILANAARYAKSCIEIYCHQKKEFIEIQIQDDGKGIKEEDLPHIFERFYKGDDGNTGIGLSITKDIVQKHHAQIFVQSNHGAVFTILFPVDDDSP